MTPDFRALCAELVRIADALDGGTRLISNQGQALDGFSALVAFRDVARRARAALAEEPEPEGPTDEELLGVAVQAVEPYDKIGLGEYEAENNCCIEVYGSELIAFARAVLARWGHQPAPPAEGEQRHPTPVPVAERLPEPEDCDAGGRCWAWDWLAEKWCLCDRTSACHGFDHWLPATALPLPAGEVEPNAE